MRLRWAAVLLPLLLAGCGAPGAGTSIHGHPSAATPPGDSLAALPPITEPARLKGLSDGQVRAAMGAPSFRRRDPPAEIWQYRGRLCTLDLFLYGSDRGLRVDHYTIRGNAQASDKDCFDELLARPRQAPEG